MPNLTVSSAVDTLLGAADNPAILATIGALGPAATSAQIVSGLSNVVGITPLGLSSAGIKVGTAAGKLVNFGTGNVPTLNSTAVDVLIIGTNNAPLAAYPQHSVIIGNYNLTNLTAAHSSDLQDYYIVIGHNNLKTNPGEFNYVVGRNILNSLNSGAGANDNNYCFGDRVLEIATTANDNACFGDLCLGYLNAPGNENSNSCLGNSSGFGVGSGSFNTFVGNSCGGGLLSFSGTLGPLTMNNCTLVGCDAVGLPNGTTLENLVAVGAFAGQYTSETNSFWIDSLDRTNETNQKVQSLFYGKFDPSVTNQFVKINGNLTIRPWSSSTPANNGEVTFETTSNTQLKIKYKGTDGTVRSISLSLA